MQFVKIPAILSTMTDLGCIHYERIFNEDNCKYHKITKIAKTRLPRQDC